MGQTPGQTGMALLKGGLTGVGQGLQQQQNPNQQFNFQPFQQGLQNFRAKQKKPMQVATMSPYGPDVGNYE